MTEKKMSTGAVVMLAVFAAVAVSIRRVLFPELDGINSIFASAVAGGLGGGIGAFLGTKLFPTKEKKND